MVDVSYIAIREEWLPKLRAWFGSLADRRAEVDALAHAQTLTHEMAHLVRTEQGCVLVYALEAFDLAAARAALRGNAPPLAASGDSSSRSAPPAIRRTRRSSSTREPARPRSLTPVGWKAA